MWSLKIHNRKRKMYEKAEHALRKGAGGHTLLCDNATYLKVYSISECSQIRSINIRMIRVFE